MDEEALLLLGGQGGERGRGRRAVVRLDAGELLARTVGEVRAAEVRAAEEPPRLVRRSGGRACR